MKPTLNQQANEIHQLKARIRELESLLNDASRALAPFQCAGCDTDITEIGDHQAVMVIDERGRNIGLMAVPPENRLIEFLEVRHLRRAASVVIDIRARLNPKVESEDA